MVFSVHVRFASVQNSKRVPRAWCGKGQRTRVAGESKACEGRSGPRPRSLDLVSWVLVKGFKLSYHFLGIYSKSYGFLITLTRIKPLNKNPVSVPARATGVWTGSSEAVML